MFAGIDEMILCALTSLSFLLPRKWAKYSMQVTLILGGVYFMFVSRDFASIVLLGSAAILSFSTETKTNTFLTKLNNKERYSLLFTLFGVVALYSFFLIKLDKPWSNDFTLSNSLLEIILLILLVFLVNSLGKSKS